jgi:hypothetical protein
MVDQHFHPLDNHNLYQDLDKLQAGWTPRLQDLEGQEGQVERTQQARRRKVGRLPGCISRHWRGISCNGLTRVCRSVRMSWWVETPTSRASAREKLTRLTKLQFQELSTDVYDELMRRLEADRGENDGDGTHPEPGVRADDQYHFCQSETTSIQNEIRLDRNSQHSPEIGSRI